MPPKRMNDSQARAVHIPAHVQQAMDRHMQGTMPANLKYYQQSGAYVPPHIQQAMQKHMQATMPEHLQAYISPYMQQKVVPQHFGASPTPNTAPINPPVHVMNNFDHPLTPTFNQSGTPVQPTDSLQAPIPPNNSVETLAKPTEPYGFILDSEAKAASPLAFFQGKSFPIRIAIISGGLLIVILLLVGVKSIFSSPPKLQPYISVVQDQQVLIHLVSNTLQPTTGQSPIPASYANFLNTTKLTVTSSQSQLITYLTINKQKVTTKQIVSKENPSIDSQLTQSASTGGYTTLFQSTMTSALNTYLIDLKNAYSGFNGKKGRALISSDYAQAILLNEQLTQANASATD